MNKSTIVTILSTAALGLMKKHSGSFGLHYRPETLDDVLNFWEKDRKRVTTLHLDAMFIKEIPNGLFDGFDNLEVLVLDNNNLTEIPESITNIRTLKKLYLSGNRIKSIPHHIKNLENLEFLGLGSNEIQYIAPEIGNLVNLEHLYLQENRIESLPREIGNLIHLDHLALSENENLSYPDQRTALFWAKNLPKNIMREIIFYARKHRSSSQLRKF